MIVVVDLVVFLEFCNVRSAVVLQSQTSLGAVELTNGCAIVFVCTNVEKNHNQF